MDEFLRLRISELEGERRMLDKKLHRLCARRDVFRSDAERLRDMDIPGRERIFKAFTAIAGDVAYEAVIRTMEGGMSADTYDKCMDIIRAESNADELAREFVRSCPYLVAFKLDRDVNETRQRALVVNTQLHTLYEAGLRMIDSLHVSTSKKM